MIKVYLFDWGDTLMVDYPGVPGKMCDWNHVESVNGAARALERLSESARIFVATGAADSTESEIASAFERVGLHSFIEGYFCKSNIGFNKGAPEFLQTILEKLNVPRSQIAMVGDSLEKDIEPAIQAGIHPIWLTQKLSGAPAGVRTISSLDELENIAALHP